MAEVWRNWGRNQLARPQRVAAPRDVDEVSTLVQDAARDGLRVKPVGAGHSFTSAAVTDGVQVRMTSLDRVLAADPSTGRVTVQAGIPLHRLNQELEGRGLAMTNLGDIDRQTISGATSTGTHGTGARFGGLSTQIAGLQLVLGDGSVVECSAEARPDLFAAARVGIGALGVVTAVTLQCVPKFLMHAVEGPMRFDEVLERLDEFVAETDHFEFYWFPHTDRTLTKRNTRLPGDAEASPLGRWKSWVDDELMANFAFGLTQRTGHSAPRLIRRLNRIAGGSVGGREFTDVSHRVFVSPRRVRFREMEYAVPRESIRDVVRGVRDWIDTSGEPISFPIEVRFAAADDIWLSTASGRESAYVAVHQYFKADYERYFRAVESIMSEVGGRPHWGKLHFLDATTLRERYPRFDDFRRVRDEVDPQRVFANAYTERVLGP